MSKELWPVNTVTDVSELPPGFLDFYLPLHKELAIFQKAYVRLRAMVLSSAKCGKLPGYGDNVVDDSDWKIQLPEWCADQRNQMTGPADDAELVVKMLNSGAPGVMIDFEDSMANTWPRLRQGIENAVSALHGELSYNDRKTGETVGIKKSKTVTWVRVRGLHINQAGVVKDELTPASLFDFALLAYLLDIRKLKHPLCIYIPKSENSVEAFLWSWIFTTVSRAKGWSEDFVKCMALVESHPLVYQMEAFIYTLKDHIVGLNLGRWDYMASLIHYTMSDPNWVLPDRNTIPHDVPFFQRLRELLVHVCHKRGILAIGGMTALYPSRTDSDLNARALHALAKDKRNESEVGMDGAWTGHPDQNEIAVSAFPPPNQLFRTHTDETRPDLRPVPAGIGAVTLAGTEAAIRTCIRYRFGVLSGKGASLLDGYMEDLATDRIYRLMIAQRVKHEVEVDIGFGLRVLHGWPLISSLFDSELAKILESLPDDVSKEVVDRYWEARKISEELIRSGDFDPR
jgi:malate synthase